MTLRENLADSIATIRRTQKKSLSEFAEELAISRSSLQDILKGKGNPTLSTVELVADQLDLDPLLLLSCSEGKARVAARLSDLFDWFRQLPDDKQQEFVAAFNTILSMLTEAGDNQV